MQLPACGIEAALLRLLGFHATAERPAFLIDLRPGGLWWLNLKQATGLWLGRVGIDW